MTVDDAGLRAIRPPPAVADFAAFWSATRAEAAAVAPDIELSDRVGEHRGHGVRIVRFTVLGGHRTGAWLLEPREPPARALVVGHGYGGRTAPDAAIAPRDAVVLLPCAPGFGLSRAADLPGSAERHVLHGIGARATYLIRACVAQLWAAADVLQALHPVATARLQYHGTSFGGGLGALALPWDARFRAAWLDLPTFGHQPLRLCTPCLGSGEAVRAWHGRHPEAADVLAYYDAAVAATRIAVPVVCSPARVDEVVPPAGQWAVANALPQGRIVPRSIGHGAGPDGVADWRAILHAVRELPW